MEDEPVFLDVHRQFNALCEIFPDFTFEDLSNDKYKQKPPDGFDGWLVRPKWWKIASSSYHEAVHKLCGMRGVYLESSMISNRIPSLIHVENACAKKHSGDVLILPICFNSLNVLESNGFGLGIIDAIILHLYYPNISKDGLVVIDCFGDECNKGAQIPVLIISSEKLELTKRDSNEPLPSFLKRYTLLF